VSEWVSEWVSEKLLSNSNSAIAQLCHGENKIIINEMMMRFALFYTNTLSWIFIVLANWNNSPRVDMSIHSETLFWFRANQSFLFLLNAACLAEKQQMPILYSMVWTNPGSNPRSAALETSTLTITPPIMYWKVYDAID
jgi:hypothetical protein